MEAVKRPRGRPPQAAKMTDRIQVFFRPGDLDRIYAAAADAGISASEYIRRKLGLNY